jgi:hypothetical protein
MAAEWLAVAKGVTGISEKIFGGLTKYRKLKAEERKRLADLLDEIANEVLAIAKQMNKREIPNTVDGGKSIAFNETSRLEPTFR